MPTEPEKQVDESEFMDIAKDPAEARALHKSLRMIAGGGVGDALKEMAQEVLSGRVGLRQAMQISGYTDEMLGKSEFQDKWMAMSDTERYALAAEGEQTLEKERREIAEERREAQRQSFGDAEGHRGKGWSLY
jgi:hypothetical protein